MLDRFNILKKIKSSKDKKTNKSRSKPKTSREKTLEKFMQHRLGIIGFALLAILYLGAIFADFLAPYHYNTSNAAYSNAPPSKIRIKDSQGKIRLPFVYGIKTERDPVTYGLKFTEDTERIYNLKLFVKGDKYKAFLFIPFDIHLFGLSVPSNEAMIIPFGADRFGRDMYSRILHGGRVSLSVGLLGTFITMVLGSIIGALSGYYGGWIDTLVQRFIELLRSFPRIPLWLAFAMILPPQWPSTLVYLGMIMVLSLIGWMGVARVIRGMCLSLREKYFVLSARVSGVSSLKIVTRHLLPNVMSYLIVVATLSIPSMILGESTISFLGLGIKEPMTSWGLLLKQAQSFSALRSTPWFIIPGFFIMLTTLSFNFVGDAVRDALDPYGIVKEK